MGRPIGWVCDAEQTPQRPFNVGVQGAPAVHLARIGCDVELAEFGSKPFLKGAHRWRRRPDWLSRGSEASPNGGSFHTLRKPMHLNVSSWWRVAMSFRGARPKPPVSTVGQKRTTITTR